MGILQTIHHISVKHSKRVEAAQLEGGDHYSRQHDGGGRQCQELDRGKCLQGG